MTCIFCEIIQGQRPGKVVYQDERAVAFEDINPQAPTHVLVVPRKHIATLNDIEAADCELIGYLFRVATDLAKQRGIDQSGYRTVINTNHQAGQSVYHIHVHLLGGRTMHWPPG